MGASVGKLFDSDDEGEDLDVLSQLPSPRERGKGRMKMQRIFQRNGSEVTDGGDDGPGSEDLKSNQHHSTETLQFLRGAMEGFDFFQDLVEKSDGLNRKVELIIHFMTKESFSKGTPLIIEGESGDKLYIVEEGELGVTIRGEQIRTIGRGALLGELALVYDCPRSATVVCKTDCTVFSLQRRLFKKVLTVSVDAVATQRSRWLLNSPELAIMSPMNLSRLVSSLKPVKYQREEIMYREMTLTSQVTLIERGTAVVMTSMDLRGFAQTEIDKMFGIIRPQTKQRIKSVNEMNFGQLQSFLKRQGNEVESPSNSNFSTTSLADYAKLAMDHSCGTETIASAMSRDSSKTKILTLGPGGNNSDVCFYEACELHEGCIVGIGALRGKAGMPNGWRWVGEAELLKKGLPPGELAETPFSVEARGDCETLTFSVENFEALFGAITNIFGGEEKADGDRAGLPSIPELPQRTGFPFDMSRFKILSVLGSGSFGTVTLAEYTHDAHSPNKSAQSLAGGPRASPHLLPGGEKRRYALKSLSKTAIIETGQLRHVVDERNLLFAMDDPFVLKLYGVYQTPHQIVMVTEAVECGDLWGVIYEEKLVSSSGGIPHDLVPLYAASLIYALEHIHSKLVVFRDLKPENVMIDRSGYPVIIDFGFAKRVPFQKKDESGVLKIYAKTFTLCGTPEYLPPELIFNAGHDQMADLWSLGVVVYEMVMGRTPFAPRKPDNITELFTNIAMAKKNGLLLSTRIDDRAGKNAHARDLITQLLKAEPTDRLAKESSTKGLLKHPYFSTNINVQEVYRQTITPSFIPPIGRGGSAATLPSVRAYRGDQSLFDPF